VCREGLPQRVIVSRAIRSNYTIAGNWEVSETRETSTADLRMWREEWTASHSYRSPKGGNGEISETPYNAFAAVMDSSRRYRTPWVPQSATPQSATSRQQLLSLCMAWRSELGPNCNELQLLCKFVKMTVVSQNNQESSSSIHFNLRNQSHARWLDNRQGKSCPTHPTHDLLFKLLGQYIALSIILHCDHLNTQRVLRWKQTNGKWLK
jgi:hypothetical protein